PPSPPEIERASTEALSISGRGWDREPTKWVRQNGRTAVLHSFAARRARHTDVPSAIPPSPPEQESLSAALLFGRSSRLSVRGGRSAAPRHLYHNMMHLGRRQLPCNATMDTELARTFLAVIATGSFVDAAQKLYVTQSTVSARIQRLEEELGAALFVRNKAGTTLTPAGRQFQKHATVLTRTVEQARQEIGIVEGFKGTLTVGGRVGLWEDLLLHWLPAFAQVAPDIAVRALIGFEDDLMQALIEGRAD